MNKLDIATRAKIVACLVEGNSIRSTSRMTGAAKNTIISLLVRLGSACAAYQDKSIFETFIAREYSVMKFGHFVMQKKRMSLLRSKVS